MITVEDNTESNIVILRSVTVSRLLCTHSYGRPHSTEKLSSKPDPLKEQMLRLQRNTTKPRQ